MAISDADVRDLLQRLQGFTMAIDTPLGADGELDGPALERMIDRVITAGAKGLLVLGWMGQGPLLPEKLRAEVVRETVRIVDGRTLVVAGVSEQSLERALGQAEAVQQAGADILLSTPPYSYAVSEDQLCSYFTALAEETNMPVMIYHNTEITIQPDLSLVLRLCETPGVIGIKSFSNFNLLQQYFYRASRPDRFAVFSASMYHLAAAMFLGFRHFMVGTPGNLTPSLCVQMLRDADSGDWEAVRNTYNRMIELFNLVAIDTDAGDVTVKFILSELGLCEPHVLAPLAPLSDADKTLAREAMQKYADILG
jgi:4-hydroxy-tetrahydrodipicolinate synthase